MQVGATWERDERTTLLSRTKSMNFAQNQLAMLEAKYSGEVAPEQKEKTCLELIVKTHAEDDRDAIFKFHTNDYFVSVFRIPMGQQETEVNIGERLNKFNEKKKKNIDLFDSSLSEICENSSY
jgi:hypothetical protein